MSGDLLHILLPSGEDNIADSEKCGSFQPSREVQNQGSSINNVEVRDKEEYNDTCMTESSCSQQEVKAEKCSEENDLLEIPDEEDVVRDSEVNRYVEILCLFNPPSTVAHIHLVSFLFPLMRCELPPHGE